MQMGKIICSALGAILIIVSAGFSDPQIAWWYGLDAPSFGSAAAGDIDGDGMLELVFGTYFNDEHIYALNAENGTLLWSYDTGGCNDASPLIYDVDLDGELEVIAPASSPYTVYCFNGTTGAVEWSTSTGYPNCIDSPPGAADLDNDGLPEVVLGTFYGHVFCLNGENGSVLWQADLGTNSYIQTDPAILDCNNDGQLDVVVGQWQGDCRVYALNGDDGTVLWFSDIPEDWMYHGASFADIDEDGLPELVIGNYDGDLYVFNAEDGSLLWEYPGVLYIGAPTTIADLNNDGHWEIAMISYTTLKVLSHTGTLLWSYGLGASAFRGCAAADMNGDGIVDLTVGADNGILRVINGNNGILQWSIDLQAAYGNTYNIDNAPVIADFDNDDSLDVFIVGGYGTSSQPQHNHGRGYMIAGFAGMGEGWSMFRRDERHSACFPRPSYDIDVVLTPAGLPIQIPANGGNFSFLIAVTNNEQIPAAFSVWTMADMPGGTVYGPIIGPVALNLNPGASLSRNRTQSVPAAAPAGQYAYRAYAGYYPFVIFDEDSFPFEKLTADDGGIWISDWSAGKEGWYDGEDQPEIAFLPQSATLSVYPNPFNSTGNIEFELLAGTNVDLKIYNVRGQIVDTLVKGWREAGKYDAQFSGEGLPSGVYFIKLMADGRWLMARKVVLLK